MFVKRLPPAERHRFLSSIILEVGLSEKAQIFAFGTDPKSSKDKQFAVGLVIDALEIVLRIKNSSSSFEMKRNFSEISF